ncbi:MAG TPA: sigma-70 family RNA polymerase sigma factor [Blastocatellia bacterium]|nr:sigma-70 family RNA polymerase sigma factor [Blastocatellia bacterium]HMV85484.1 sigma-70 family RNA polymerase sigma factor [Blastocatellia bacterium]HMX26274.1 sigma-70 family RNA polymerase sigma factor [Blastocatellia bacterium]HMY71573.1 sigma-70 family RNA polymerase sigma factor [Blastocatellia bacterium]HMZ18701.1 sigma-70 family RNA polymerase sigma factor [Blastocatellia bacterium]
MKKSLDHLGDEELLRQMSAGDSLAFAELYRRWQSSVYRFALRMSGAEALAEDVTQDVFLTLMRDGGQYEGRGTFSSYVFTITRHSVLRRLQRERRFISFEQKTDVEADNELPFEEAILDEDPLAQLARNEMIEAVRQAVQALPLHYREVVLLCHLHELSYAEAAEIIGCEIGTVCSRLYRARALLGKRLAALKSEPAPQLNLARCSI